MVDEYPDFDLEAFRLPKSYQIPAPVFSRKIKQKIIREKANDWFIKGPLPGTWYERAAKLPGHSLHVALAIWYVSGLKGNHVILMERFHFDRFGVASDATRRGLIQLMNAGLIVYSKVGHKFKVTILNDE